MSETKTRTLDATGGASAYADLNGMVRVDLWCTDRQPREDPIIVLMTPGQAMGLCAQLANASAVSLRDALKP